MLRGDAHKRRPSGGRPAGLHGRRRAAIADTPAARRCTAGNAARLLAAGGLLLGAWFWTASGVMQQMHADQAAAPAECTALTLDRATGQTYSGPCAGSSAQPAILTALLPSTAGEPAAPAR